MENMQLLFTSIKKKTVIGIYDTYIEAVESRKQMEEYWHEEFLEWDKGINQVIFE